MAKVFGGGNKGPGCGDGGVTRSIPTSRDAISPSDQQTYTSQPNIYSKPRSGDSGVFDQREYYTKADINRFLKLKADLSAVYTEEEVDRKLSDLQSAISSSLGDYVTSPDLTLSLQELEDSIFVHLSTNYYTTENLYTKTEIDNLISALDIGDGFIKSEPTLQSEAFIDAGDEDVIALRLKGSTSSNISDVQTWIDHENNTIGRVLKSGQVDFYGNMMLGENIPSWRPALDVSERRIAGVADPMDRLDAINKRYMEDYISEVIDNVDDKNYIVDALVY